MTNTRPHSGKKKNVLEEEEKKELARAERREANRIREERKAWRKEKEVLLVTARGLIRLWYLAYNNRFCSILTTREVEAIHTMKRDIESCIALGLDVDKIAKYPQEARKVSQALRDNVMSTTLYLTNGLIREKAVCAKTGDASHGCVHGIYYIAEKLKNPTQTVSALYINRNGIKQDIWWVAQALKTNKALKILCLNGNQVGSVGAKALCDGLRHNASLNHLCINENEIGDEGLQHIAFLMEESRVNDDGNITGQLHVLWVSDNGITDEGIFDLAKAMKKNHNLTILGIMDNEITDKGMRALCEAIVMGSHKLTKVCLDGNAAISTHWIDTVHALTQMNVAYSGPGCWSLRRRRPIFKEVPAEMHRMLIVMLALSFFKGTIWHEILPKQVRENSIPVCVMSMLVDSQRRNIFAKAVAIDDRSQTEPA